MFNKKSKARENRAKQVESTVTVAKDVTEVHCHSDSLLVTGRWASIIGTRKEQQDSCATVCFHADAEHSDESLLAVVCDGIGGFIAGKEASSTAVAALIETFQTQRPIKDFARTFESGICLADRRVVALAKSLGGRTGTTCVAAHIQNARLFWGSVGDSRLYLFRNGNIVCLTRDHNYALTLQTRVQRGELSQEAADSDPERESLISFIGMNDVAHIDTAPSGIPLADGDIVVLCSDGLYKSLPTEELLTIVSQYASAPAFLPGVLAAAAFDKDLPHQDNTTVVVISCQGDSK